MTRKRVFALLSIAALAACGGSDSTATGSPSAEVRTEVVHIQGYRLAIQRDAAGTPTSAQAWDPSGVEVPTEVSGLGEVTVCAPVSAAESAGSAQCEPLFSFVPDETFIKYGAATCTCTIIFQKLKCYGDTCP